MKHEVQHNFALSGRFGSIAQTGSREAPIGESRLVCVSSRDRRSDPIIPPGPVGLPQRCLPRFQRFQKRGVPHRRDVSATDFYAPV
jgi:hypothetical protein